MASATQEQRDKSKKLFTGPARRYVAKEAENSDLGLFI